MFCLGIALVISMVPLTAQNSLPPNVRDGPTIFEFTDGATVQCQTHFTYVMFARSWEQMVTVIKDTSPSVRLGRLEYYQTRALEFYPLTAEEESQLKSFSAARTPWSIFISDKDSNVRKVRWVRTDGKVEDPVWVYLGTGGRGFESCTGPDGEDYHVIERSVKAIRVAVQATRKSTPPTKKK
jgi:hypothetical protein